MDTHSLGIVIMALGVVLLLSGLASYRLMRTRRSRAGTLAASALLIGPGVVILVLGFGVASFEPS